MTLLRHVSVTFIHDIDQFLVIESVYTVFCDKTMLYSKTVLYSKTCLKQPLNRIPQKKVFKTDNPFMQGKSFAECSRGAFCSTFDLH